jgi:hypothetical protein
MKHLLIGTDFRDNVQLIINDGKAIVHTLKPITGNKKVRVMCQLRLDLVNNEVNNVKVTHALNN